jgi:hypothetical protein
MAGTRIPNKLGWMMITQKINSELFLEEKIQWMNPTVRIISYPIVIVSISLFVCDSFILPHKWQSLFFFLSFFLSFFLITSEPGEENGDESKKQNTESQNAFLRKREEALEDKKFDLQYEDETVVTGRVVGACKDWEGTWPAIREFCQNTVDHLQLFDHTTGRRNKDVDLEIFHPRNPAGHRGAADDEDEDKADKGAAKTSDAQREQIPLVVFTFSCGDVVLCKITVMSEDELVIEQAYTCPLSRLMLYTGVKDKSKQTGTTAGGSTL